MQGDVEGIRGLQPDIVGALSVAEFLDVGEVGTVFLLVGLAGCGGIDEVLGAGLQIGELGGTAEVEVDFAGIEDMKHDEIIAPRAEVSEARFEIVNGGEEIGDEYEHSAAAVHFGNALERFAESGCRTYSRGLSDHWFKASEVFR